MHPFEIISERETSGGWAFEVQLIGDPAGALRSVTLVLSWPDYSHWSPDGADRASAVAEAVMAFLLRHLAPGDLPDRFDASLARRRFPDADEAIPRLIRR